ncbi:MAG: tetratricopeptide repeat protein [Candidatus Binatia bacterium]
MHGLRALILLASLAGCTRDGAAELMETAKFEELQQNVPHARELYQRIVTDYPDSPEAKVARERLAALPATSD